MKDSIQEPTTLKEPPRTIIESEKTRRESEVAALGDSAVVGLTFLGLESFRGWPILEQLPTKGSESDIYLVRAEGERCVLKLYRHRLEPKLEILNRIAELSRKNSRHFVVFKDVGFDERTGRWYELQEYISLGSLRDVPPETKYSPSFVRNLVFELAGAIHRLHVHEIVHCDVKPANVLVRSLDPLDLALTDFGISSVLASDMSQKMTSLKGTPMYWAPEAFSRVIGRPCDWWGLGMIALEFLAGEHPFENLTDSQIIHKLTVGNVEISENLAPEWSLLLKGLLTKDDARRWGYGEVSRWLSGERDIAVHYELSAALSKETERFNQKNQKTNLPPFIFEGKEYFTPEDLARVFSENQNPWFSGFNTLRQVRQWLESNLLFDEAEKLGNDSAKLDAERALFRFVHGSAQCPFSLLGRRINVENLRLFLERAMSSEAWTAEKRLAGMLGSGSLLSFYDEYVALTGNQDPALHDLLLFMDKKTPSEQWRCFEALDAPDVCLWPEDARRSDRRETLETLKEMGVVPLKRDVLEKLEQTYILPWALLGLFRSASTYASGVERLEQWQFQGLLFRRDSRFFGSEDLSLDEYERTARARCLGYAPAVLEKLDFVREAFSTFPPPRDSLEAEVFSRTVARLDRLRERKITSADALFLTEAAGLLEARRKIVRAGRMRLAVSAACGGLVLGLFSSYPYFLVFPLGAFFGGAAYRGMERRSLSRNAERVLGACGLYCVSVAGEGAEDTRNSSGRWSY